MPASPLPDKSPPLRLHRRASNALPRASSFTGASRILHTSKLHITADHAPTTTSTTSQSHGVGGVAIVAMADHLENKLAPTTNGETLPKAQSKEGIVNKTDVPKAPSLNGLVQGASYVPRHAKIYKVKLNDLTPVVQATHPLVKGVAIYTKSGGEKVEVDVCEYVAKLNAEIVRLRGVARGLEERVEAMEERKGGLKKVGTFLRGRSGEVEKKSNGMEAMEKKEDVPEFEAKAAVSFPKSFTEGRTEKPAFVPKPAVSFPGPARAATFVKTSTSNHVGSTQQVKKSNSGKDKREDPMTAALSAVEKFELKKPATIASTKTNTKKKTATLSGKEANRHLNRLEKRTARQSTFVKPKQKNESAPVNSSTFTSDRTTGAMPNPQVSTVKRLRKSLSFINKGKDKEMKKVASVSKLPETVSKLPTPVEKISIPVLDKSKMKTSTTVQAKTVERVEKMEGSAKKVMGRRRIFSTFIRGKR